MGREVIGLDVGIFDTMGDTVVETTAGDKECNVGYAVGELVGIDDD